jgi:Protein phosphatase 2C
MGDAIAGMEGAMAAKDRLVPQILDRWRLSVAADVSRTAFSGHEESLRLAGDSPEVAYGSTLLVGVWTDDWVLCIQIGDGDILAVSRDTGVLCPVPADPHIVGHRTTSLCQPDARAAFRFGILDASAVAPCALMLATDGFANSQTHSPWQDKVGAEIADRLSTGGTPLVHDGLRSWVALCASSDGSGDDTTAAMVVRNEEGPL